MKRTTLTSCTPLAAFGLAAMTMLATGCLTPAHVTTVDADALSQLIGLPASEPANSNPTQQPGSKAATIDRGESLSSAANRPGFDRFPLPPERLPTSESTFVKAIQIEEVPQPLLPPPATAAAARIKAIHEISLDIAAPPAPPAPGEPPASPDDYSAEATAFFAASEPFTRDAFIDSRFDWVPAPEGLEFCYQPLYFEEVNVERYGRNYGILQPVVSCVQFYGRIPLLPYMAFAQPARQCAYHAHWTLPGYRIPCRERHPLYVSAKGGAAETAAVIGLFLLIP
jgi:hypothetical protein